MKKRHIKKKNKSFGGRAARSGFYFQDLIGAKMILEMWRNYFILSVILEADKADYVNDIVVKYKDRTEYFQVKGTKDPSKTYTPSEFIKIKGKKNSILAELYKSWNKLKQEGETFSLFLISNIHPSKKLNNLIKNCLDNIENYSDINDIPSEFRQTINKWLDKIQEQLAVNMSFKELKDFISCLTLDLAQPQEKHLEDFIREMLRSEGFDPKRDFEILMTKVSEWARKGIEVNAEILLNAFGKKERLVERMPHEFPIDESKYVIPIEMNNEIKERIKDLQFRYIFLEGGPGTGKSWFVTMLSKEDIENALFIHYYCFIPEKDPFRRERILRERFLLDISENIKYEYPQLLRNVSGGRRTLRADFISLLSEIDKYNKENRKITVIIVDGLDHVPREAQGIPLGNLLLSELPKPDEVPERIKFLVTSRPSPKLPDFLYDDSQVCKIKVCPFRRSQVEEYLKKRNLFDKIHEDIVDNIHQISEGLPLYLEIVVNSIEEEVKKGNHYPIKIIQNLPKINGDIRNYCRDRVWPDIKEIGIKGERLIAFISRLRIPFNEELIHKLMNKELSELEIKDILRKISAIFNKSNNVFTFHHSIFREYFIEKTIEQHEEINRNIAEFFYANLNSDLSQAELIYYLFEGREYEKVISLVNQERIEDKIHLFRSLKEVEEELFLALEATAKTKDVKEFSRIALLLIEFLIRKDVFNYEDGLKGIAYLLKQLGWSKEAKRLIGRKDDSLPIEMDEVERALYFYKKGNKEAAEKELKIAERAFIRKIESPLSFEPYDEKRKSYVERFIEIIILFKNASEIIELAKKIKWKIPKYIQQNEDEIREDMLINSGIKLIEFNKWSNFQEFIEELIKIGYVHCVYHLLYHSLKKVIDSNEQIYNFLKDLTFKTAQEKIENIPQSLRILLGRIAMIKKDSPNKIKKYIGNLKIDFPNQLGPSIRNNKLDYKFFQNFHLYILQIYCGIAKNAEEIINNLRKSDEVLKEQKEWERNFVLEIVAILLNFGKIIGLLYKNNKKVNFKNEFKILLTALHKLWRFRREIGFHILENEQVKLYEGVFIFIRKHFQNYLSELAKQFESLRQHTESVDNIIIPAQKKVAKELYLSSSTENYGESLLIELDNIAKTGNGNQERFSSCLEQAKIWLSVGRKEKSLDMIHEAINGSIGIGYKDYQLFEWMDWFRILGRINSEKIIKDSPRLAYWLSLSYDEVGDSDILDIYDEFFYTVTIYDLALALRIFEIGEENSIPHIYASIPTIFKALIKEKDLKLDDIWTIWRATEGIIGGLAENNAEDCFEIFIELLKSANKLSFELFSKMISKLEQWVEIEIPYHYRNKAFKWLCAFCINEKIPLPTSLLKYKEKKIINIYHDTSGFLPKEFFRKMEIERSIEDDKDELRENIKEKTKRKYKDILNYIKNKQKQALNELKKDLFADINHWEAQRKWEDYIGLFLYDLLDQVQNPRDLEQIHYIFKEEESNITSFELINLAQKYLSFEMKDEAWKLGLKAIDKAKNFTPMLGGKNALIEPAKFLFRINPEEVWEPLLEKSFYIIYRNPYPYTLQNFFQILREIIDSNLDSYKDLFKLIYEDIERHLECLYVLVPKKGNPFQNIYINNHLQSISEQIINFLFWFTKHPLSTLKLSALSSLRDLLEDIPKHILPVSFDYIKKNELTDKENALVVTDSITAVNPEIIHQFVQELFPLLDYEHMLIRETARGILKRVIEIHKDLIPKKIQRKVLEPYDKSKISTRSDIAPIIPSEKINSIKYIIGTTPEKKLSASLNFAKTLAKISGVQEKDAIYNISQIMDELGFDSEKYKELDEKNKKRIEQYRPRGLIENKGVYYYTTPWNKLTQHAINIYFGNLLKDRQLYAANAANLINAAFPFDPFRFGSYWNPKPSDITPLYGKMEEEKWINFKDVQTDEIIERHKNLHCKWVILFESYSQHLLKEEIFNATKPLSQNVIVLSGLFSNEIDNNKIIGDYKITGYFPILNPAFIFIEKYNQYIDQIPKQEPPFLLSIEKMKRFYGDGRPLVYHIPLAVLNPKIYEILNLKQSMKRGFILNSTDNEEVVKWIEWKDGNDWGILREPIRLPGYGGRLQCRSDIFEKIISTYKAKIVKLITIQRRIHSSKDKKYEVEREGSKKIMIIEKEVFQIFS